MPSKEYILIPTSQTIIFPYETGKITINKNFSNLFFSEMEIILGSYKNPLEENSLIVSNNLEKEPLETAPISISSYGVIVKILKLEEKEDGLELSVFGIKRALILTGDFRQNTIFVKYKEFEPLMQETNYKEFNELRLDISNLILGKDEGVNIYNVLSMEPLNLLYFASRFLSDNDYKFKLKQLEEISLVNGLKNLVKEYFKYNKKFKEQVDQEVYAKFKKNIEDHQKNYLLNEQMKTIKNELEKINPEKENNLEEEIKKKEGMPEGIRETLLREYEKIRNTNPLSSEYSVVKNYLNLALSLPWNKSTPIKKIPLREVEKIIKEKHYGLDDVTENILQYIASSFKTEQQKTKVLLLQGPPGVGKTSVGEVIAKCLGREFVFISLVSIESADFFGHRRTYVGSYPGRIINSLIETQVNNPLIFLDEVDKMNKTQFNNPLNILVSLLDPTQNFKFTDQFLSFPFDVSKCVFVLTTNSLDSIPDYLLSRMEIIKIDGYTLDEKKQIASKFLLPKIFEEYSLKKNEIIFKEEAIEKIIKSYTREMGVRKLQQTLNKIVSKVIYLNMKKEEEKEKENSIKTVTNNNLKELLRDIPLAFDFELHPCEAIGMAWTSVGGDILKIQALFVNSGKGEILITGNLGQVMKESVQVALSLLKNSQILKKIKIPDNFFSTHSLHIHVPEGATPKDGPSAGITIYTAIMSGVISQVTGIPYKVPLISMTGEVGLSIPGEVMAIGGLKQKILAALNYGIKEVIVPEENRETVEKFRNFPFEKVKINYAKYINDVENIMFSDFVDGKSEKSEKSEKKIEKSLKKKA